MISSRHFTHKKFNFPCGETQVAIETVLGRPIDGIGAWGESGFSINWVYENEQELIELLLLVDALQHLGLTVNTLFLPYVPYSRQDRVVNWGESLSIKVFCNLINSLNFKKVVITDPHSSVTPALLNNCTVLEQHFIFQHYFRDKKNFILVSPDTGAQKKINELARIVKPRDIIPFFKYRDPDSGDVRLECFYPFGHDTETEFIIVDDICDGGATFVKIAKYMREELMIDPINKITLMVTHGFFTKGIEVFDGLIDHIYTREGKVK